MYSDTLHESTIGMDLKRKRGKGHRGSSRRMRETLFFRLLTEGDAGSGESVATTSGAATVSMVPAWLRGALSS